MSDVKDIKFVRSRWYVRLWNFVTRRKPSHIEVVYRFEFRELKDRVRRLEQEVRGDIIIQ